MNEAQAISPSLNTRSNLSQRLLTAAIGVPVLIWILFEPPEWCFLLLLFATTAVGAWELMKMTVPSDRVLHVWGIVAAVGIHGVFATQTSSTSLLTAIMVLVVGSLLMALLRPRVGLEVPGAVAWLIAGPLYVGGLLATLALLHRKPHGGAWVLLCLMIAWLGDSLAYFAGRAFGRHKLYAAVSPKKTLEGALGGLMGSVLGALLAHFWYLPSLPLWSGVALAIFGGALGQMGDLSESMVKRSTGVKDSSMVVPGHGGVLDRIDALLFSAAATWIYVEWIQGSN